MQDWYQINISQWWLHWSLKFVWMIIYQIKIWSCSQKIYNDWDANISSLYIHIKNWFFWLYMKWADELVSANVVTQFSAIHSQHMSSSWSKLKTHCISEISFADYWEQFIKINLILKSFLMYSDQKLRSCWSDSWHFITSHQEIRSLQNFYFWYSQCFRLLMR